MLERMYEIMMRIREIQRQFYTTRNVYRENHTTRSDFSEYLSETLRGQSPVGNHAYSTSQIQHLENSNDAEILRRAAFSDIVRRYATQYNIPVALVNAIIEVESSFNPRAISPRGALGLMQLMPEVAAALGVENPFEPEENIRGGVIHLRRLLDKYNGDYAMALAAYNAGEGAVDRSGGIPNFVETRNFVNNVLRAYFRNSNRDVSYGDASIR